MSKCERCTQSCSQRCIQVIFWRNAIFSKRAFCRTSDTSWVIVAPTTKILRRVSGELQASLRCASYRESAQQPKKKKMKNTANCGRFAGTLRTAQHLWTRPCGTLNIPSSSFLVSRDGLPNYYIILQLEQFFEMALTKSVFQILSHGFA